MRIVRPILTYLGVFILFVGTTGVIVIQAFERELANFVIQAADPFLVSQVRLDEIKTDLWHNFPKASVELRKVVIKDSWDNASDNAYEVDRLFLLLNYEDILRGDFRVRHIVLKDAKVRLITRESGESNFVFWKADSTQSNDTSKFELSLDRIDVENSTFTIYNAQSQFYLNTTIRSGNFSLFSTGDNSFFTIATQLSVHQLKNGEIGLLKNTDLSLQLDFGIEGGNKFDIRGGNLTIGKLQYEVEGVIDNSGEALFTDIKVKGKHTRLESLISLSPDLLYGSLDDYEVKGGAFFSLGIKGNWSGKEVANIHLGFGIREGELLQKSSGLKLSKIFLDGHYDNGEKRSPQTSSLEIQAFTILFDKKEISGNLVLRNFDAPWCDLILKGEVDFGKLHKIFPISGVADIEGLASADVNFKGFLSDLEKPETIEKTQFGGEVTLQNVTLRMDSSQTIYKDISGDLSFQKPFLMINNLKGTLANTHIEMSGYFKNLFGWLVGDKYLVLNGDVKADFLNPGDFLPSEDETTDESSSFSFPDFLAINANVQFDSLHFGKFKAKNLKTNFKYLNRKLDVTHLHMDALNGEIDLDGQLSPLNDGDYEVLARITTHNVNIRESFIQLDELGQDYITHEHIKGLLHSTTSITLELDNQFNIKPLSIIADADFQIIGGELISVLPMMKLGGFIKVGHFEHMVFDTLSNHIFIKKGIITIPEMMIVSNTVDMRISGSQTFENVVDYRLKIAMKKLFMKENAITDKSFSFYETDMKGGMNLFVTMTGDGSDPVFKYDVKAVGKQVKEGMDREKAELKRLKEKEAALRKQQNDSLTTYHRDLQKLRRRNAIKETIDKWNE